MCLQSLCHLPHATQGKLPTGGHQGRRTIRSPGINNQMRIHTCLLACTILLSSVSFKGTCQELNGAESGVIYQEKDLEILDDIFSEFGEFQGSTAELMLLLGGYFGGSPYVEHSLEHEPEALVVNLREFDCTTFVESCLAVSLSIRSGTLSFQGFSSALKNIRYRKGVLDGYGSRIHYFSDWIYLNNLKQLISNVSQEVGGIAFHKEINFMSTHPASYPQLARDPTLIETIASQEQKISLREMYYVPKDRLPELESGLREGDIVGITTSISGLDIIHVGVLVRKSGRMHLMHASSRHKKVIISTETLEDYLANSKSATGIMLVRPL